MNTEENIARGKPATQSSTLHGGVATRAVDGRTDTTWTRSSCTHTKHKRGSWWRVDLLECFLVEKVKITNRGDCCWTRLRSFQVRIGNDYDNPMENQL